MTFEIVKSIHDKSLYQVVEDGKYRMFEGNKYQCGLYIEARKNGWDTVMATREGNSRKRPYYYKKVKIYY